MKSAIAAFFASATLAAASAQAAPVDLSTFWVSGAGSATTNSISISGDTTVSGNVKNVTSFEWNFTTPDYMPYNDYSFFVTSDLGTVTLASVSTVGDKSSSGWHTYNLTSPYSGKLTFGVANVKDKGVPSVLEVRNVTAVPEPETYAMLVAGLALVGGMARRRARQAA